VAFFGNGQPINIIAPGKQTIQFRGSVNPDEKSHDSSPFRVALSIGGDDDFDKYVLVDHVPHNNLEVINKTTVYYNYTITIPNINCTKCALNLINIQTYSLGSGRCCSYPPSSTNASQTCEKAFHSCANLVITGTQSVDAWKSTYKYTGPCGDYTQEYAVSTSQPF